MERNHKWSPTDLPSVVLSPVYLFADDTKIFRFIRTGEDNLRTGEDY